MTAADPPDLRSPYAEGPPDEPAAEALAPPAVVAVLVTHDPGPRLEDALRSLAEQDYPGLNVLVVDAGSDFDPTDRVAAVIPTAVVRRTRAGGFAEAANLARAVIGEAAFLCFVHDDVALDPGAIRLMVEEAYRSNAAICGPKLVEFDRPEVLLEVGRAIDRFGGAHTGIEPGELDQEQHDAVRDVFYVSSATMLVRADLFDALGGFDPDAFPGSEDLDLCWRARLAGARVMVVPDARVRHHEAAKPRGTGDRQEIREHARRRIRTVFTCYSVLSLVWIVPFGIVASSLEAIAFMFSRRRTDALAEARAWWWNLLRPGQVRRARRRAQRFRTVHDLDLWELQLGWSERVRSFLTYHHADERMESIGDRLRLWIDAFVDALRHPGTVAFAAFLGVLAIGSRQILTDGVPGVGTLVPWQGVRTTLDAFGSAWHDTGLGAAQPASGALAAMAGLTAATLNHPGLAQTVVVVGALVVGPLGVSRLVRRLGATRGPAMTAAILYGVNPVVRNALANGRLGPIVLFAAAPFLVLCFVRAAGFAGLTLTGRRGRAVLGLGALSAVTVAFFPPAALFLGLVALAALIGSILTGRDVVAALRGVLVVLAGAVVAGVLLLPWSLTFAEFRDDPAAFGFAFRFPDLALDDVLRFHTGPSGLGYASWGLYAAALFALVVVSGPRFSWVARAWFLAAAGIAAVYVPSQVWPDAQVPAPEGALTAAALGLAVAAGLGIGAFGDELRRSRFGWRQLLSLVAGAGVALASMGFVADAVDGRWHAAAAGWGQDLSFTGERRFEGDFRILWVGDPAILPTDPFEVRDGVAYALTVNGAGDARAILRAPRQAADAVVVDAVELALDGRTNRLGRLVAPMGVRYVAAPSRNGPGGPLGTPVGGLRARLADQLDLARLGVESGLVLYENTAWFPGRGVADEGAEVPTGDRAPIPAALRTDLAGEVTPLGDAPAGPGQVVDAQAYDDAWKATVDGRPLRHAVGFGWANTWALPDRGEVALSFTDQRPTTLMIAGQAVLWLVVAVIGWTGRRRRLRVDTAPGRSRAQRREAAELRRQARDEARDRRRRDELDDDFWAGS
jgi:GT2 family glycosyltransferase